MEDRTAELQHWQSRCDDMQVSLEYLRVERNQALEERDALRKQVEEQQILIKRLESMLQRIQIAMSEGVEL